MRQYRKHVHNFNKRSEQLEHIKQERELLLTPNTCNGCKRPLSAGITRCIDCIKEGLK